MRTPAFVENLHLLPTVLVQITSAQPVSCTTSHVARNNAAGAKMEGKRAYSKSQDIAQENHGLGNFIPAALRPIPEVVPKARSS